jgi:hypothetical protein
MAMPARTLPVTVTAAMRGPAITRKLRALFNFTACLSDRLTHFLGDHAAHFFGVVAQYLNRGDQQLRTLCNGAGTPDAEPGSGKSLYGLKHRCGCERVVADLSRPGPEGVLFVLLAPPIAIEKADRHTVLTHGDSPGQIAVLPDDSVSIVGGQ